MKFLGVWMCFLWILTLSEGKSSIGSRIIGGGLAFAGQFPFAAAINVTTSNSRHFCGGTLVSNIWIITAGQCVDGAVVFTIAVGSNKLTGEDSNKVILSTNDYVLHPDYNPETLENDIGAIKLRISLVFHFYLMKVDFLGTDFVDGSVSLSALGWGQTSDESAEFSEELLFADVVSLTNDECKLTYGNQVNNKTLCVVGNFNEGSCYGDIGGALIQTITRYLQVFVGVASFISSNGCESTDPSGYVRVADYIDWINSVLES